MRMQAINHNSVPSFHHPINPRIYAFLAENNLPSPCLVVDLEQVARNYQSLKNALPYATCHYAVKANPAPEIMKLLVSFGSHFDAASLNEINLCLEMGAKPEHILFGNTIKKKSEIEAAYAKGVRLYTVDSFQELEKLSQSAPGAKLYCRIQTSGEGAAWPLSKKFGCTPEVAVELMVRAQELGMVPFGISFHVGSQQLLTSAYDEAISHAASVWVALRTKGIELKSLDLGGGFPGHYRVDVPAIATYGEAITSSLTKYFGDDKPEVIIEPGRFISANAGVLQAEVVLVSHNKESGKRWIYMDIGKYNGLAEAEAIQYPIVTEKDGDATGRVVLAGPTCDSTDIVYEKAEYFLPLSLEAGDKLYLLSTGAYTTTYASVCFNGFAPLKEYYI